VRHVEEVFKYSDEEIDPLRWIEGFDINSNNDGEVKTVGRASGISDRYLSGIGENRLFFSRIVVGPDLVKEEAWKKCRVKVAPEGVYVPKNRWPSPKEVKKFISKPKEFKFRMVGGKEMVFCTIPVGKFEMKNPDGQRKDTHKVELTYPFWMTKYCVTVKEWREFAKYDCQDVISRTVEERFGRRFPKNPIYRAFPRNKWLAYCRFLNERYGAQLPGGYVFRLPTEAEYEWAFAGGDEKRLKEKEIYDPRSGDYVKEFAEMWDKCRMPENWEHEEGGQMYSVLFVGGRTTPTRFGVCDLCVPGGRDILLLDTYDIGENWGNRANVYDWYLIKQNCLHYEDREINPFHYAGRFSNRILKRLGRLQIFEHMDSSSYAHVVVAPDVEKEWNSKNKEDEPFSDKDFGGALLSENAEFDGISSKEPGRNTPERWRRMFSRESTIIRHFDYYEDTSGCCTRKEDAPWVQFKLDSLREITGIQLEIYRGKWWACPFKIWVSEDGKRWMEIHEEMQERNRYRIDLRRKAKVKAKYIRIGRMEGYRNESLVIHKILVYGK